MKKRRVQVAIELPIYEPQDGHCVVPVGLETVGIAPGGTAIVRAHVWVPGSVVAFACETENLEVGRLKAGKHEGARFSSATFPSEAAADGIVIPAREVEVGDEVSAELTNASGHTVFPRAYFLLETKR